MPTQRLVEVYRRNERGNWELFVEARAGEVVELTSCGPPIARPCALADMRHVASCLDGMVASWSGPSRLGPLCSASAATPR